MVDKRTGGHVFLTAKNTKFIAKSAKTLIRKSEIENSIVLRKS